MAEQFEDLEGAMSALDGPEGSTIITERNKVALKVLAEQITAGKKRIGVFYGAGHMPDMEQRMIKDLGVRRATERWLVAWDLRPAAERKADRAREAGAEDAAIEEGEEGAAEDEPAESAK